MAGADMLKVASCSSSSNAGHGSSHQTGSQVLGFLSVLALSGSVALLTLASRRKQLWHYVFESPADSDDATLERSEETEGGGSGGEREECEDSEWLPCNSSSSSSSSTSNGCSSPLKKVRFAPDVVEPSGDGQEYRRRHEMARMQAQQQQQQDHIPSRRRVNSACRTAATAMEGQPKTSRIPANRIALYNGVMQYRRQHALHCS